MVEGVPDMENINAFLKELARTYRNFSDKYNDPEDTLVVYPPRIDAWAPDGDPKDTIQSWMAAANIEGREEDELQRALADERVMVVKDTYSDCIGDTPGDIKLPDIAVRFVLARHLAALKNAENADTRSSIFKEIVDLLSMRSGDGADVSERLEEALAEIGTEDITSLLNVIVVDVTPIPYEEIPQYAAMIKEVAVSL